MSEKFEDILRQYTSALQAYVKGQGEAELQEAYAFGRKALAGRIGLLEMASIHQHTLVDFLKHMPLTEEDISNIEAANDFFKECIGPFEMTLRGFRETINNLHQLNETLEQKVLERTEALQKTAETLRALIQASPVAVIAFTPDGKIMMWNPAAERIFGWKEREVFGQPNPIVPEEKQLEYQALRKKMVKGETFDSVESIRKRKDGSLLDVSFSTAPLYDPAGNVIGIMAVVADITERKQAEEEVRKLNKELEKRVIERTSQLEVANKELEAFAYSVSHDLRAPLRAIDGFVLALQEDYTDKLDEQGKDYIQRVRAATQRMAELIDAILMLSRLTRAEMKSEKVNLSSLAKKVAEEMEKYHSKRKVDFIVMDELTAKGDQRLLRVVFENLLGNAWKFTAKCQDARIEFGSLAQSDSKTAYFVRDNGAGFDMAYVDKLFGAFQRLHSSKEFSGTGIGLATVQRIIHRHGGRVWAEGEVNKGATFYFTLGE